MKEKSGRHYLSQGINNSITNNGKIDMMVSWVMCEDATLPTWDSSQEETIKHPNLGPFCKTSDLDSSKTPCQKTTRCLGTI